MLSPSPGKKQRCPIHTTAIQHGTQIPRQKIRQESELKDEKVKLCKNKTKQKTLQKYH